MGDILLKVPVWYRYLVFFVRVIISEIFYFLPLRSKDVPRVSFTIFVENSGLRVVTAVAAGLL